MLKDKRLFIGALIGLFLCGVLNVIPVLAEDIDIKNERLSGNNRYETSAAISNAGWSQCTTVIIATGLGYADALAASSLSKSEDSPILLTSKSAMSQDIVAELKRLKASKAILVGGTAVIGAGVENQLKSLGIAITRIGGTDRYDTSKKVAETMGVKNGIIMATGYNFPDALSIAPIAGIKSMPILLSPKNSMTPSIAEFIKSKSIPVSFIVGQSDAISNSIAESLPNSKRLGGNDRYATNLIINKYFEKDLNFDTIYLATGNDFPDALAGSALAAKNNAPIFLTRKDSISSETINYLKSKNVKNVVVLGGSDVVSDKVLNDTIKSLTANNGISDNTVITSKFTDSNFKTKVYSLIKKASPAPILYSDVKNITLLELDSLHITNLSGIEYFTNLTDLYCNDNKLTTLDLSKNTALTDLDCYGNDLTILDVSKNIALISLFCGDNNLTTLDVSKNTALNYLECFGNDLTTVDISKNVALNYLECSDNKLKTLDVSKNTALASLSCGGNQLKILDVSKNTALTDLFCYGNDITTLDISKNLELNYLECSDNTLKTLDVSKNTALTSLFCSDNNLTTLDVSKNVALNDLFCSYNELIALYSIRNTGDTLEYNPQYTDSTHTTTTDSLVITIKK